MCLTNYKLEPCHCFSSPGLSWDKMLEVENIQLELLTDIEIHQFIEKKYDRQSKLYSTKIK